MLLSLMAYFHQRRRRQRRIIQTDSKPDRYIVLCTTFSTGTEMETETEMETFPDGYCTHFRDGSPSQGQISRPYSTH